MILAPGLALNVYDHRGRKIHPRGLFHVFRTIDNGSYVAQAHRRAVAICNHYFLIVTSGKQLIIGGNRESLPLIFSRRVTEFGFDPQRAFDAVKRLANDAPGQMADGVGRLVRDSSPERLEQVMRSPARKAILEGIFWQMPKQIDPAQAAGVKSSIRWNITGRPDDGIDVYQLQLDDGRFRVIKGTGGPDPRLTVTIDGVEFLGWSPGTRTR